MDHFSVDSIDVFCKHKGLSLYRYIQQRNSMFSSSDQCTNQTFAMTFNPFTIVIVYLSFVFERCSFIAVIDEDEGSVKSPAEAWTLATPALPAAAFLIGCCRRRRLLCLTVGSTLNGSLVVMTSYRATNGDANSIRTSSGWETRKDPFQLFAEVVVEPGVEEDVVASGWHGNSVS